MHKKVTARIKVKHLIPSRGHGRIQKGGGKRDICPPPPNHQTSKRKLKPEEEKMGERDKNIRKMRKVGGKVKIVPSIIQKFIFFFFWGGGAKTIGPAQCENYLFSRSSTPTPQSYFWIRPCSRIWITFSCEFT